MRLCWFVVVAVLLTLVSSGPDSGHHHQRHHHHDKRHEPVQQQQQASKRHIARAPRSFHFDSFFGFERFAKGQFDVDPEATKSINKPRKIEVQSNAAPVETRPSRAHRRAAHNTPQAEATTTLNLTNIIGGAVVMAEQGERLHDTPQVKSDGSHKGFDPEDPASMKGRPADDSRWNRHYFTPPPEDKPRAAELSANELASKQLSEQNADPEKWFPKLGSIDALDLIRNSAGPIDVEAVPTTSKIREQVEKEAARRGPPVGSSRPHAPQDTPNNNVMMMPLITVGTALMGSGGPVGYDASGMLMTDDLNNQIKPETDRCFSLEETWLKQCSAPAQVYLQLDTRVGPGARAAFDSPDQTRSGIRAAMYSEAKTQFGDKTVSDVIKQVWKKTQDKIRAQSRVPLRFAATQGASSSRSRDNVFGAVSFLQLPGNAPTETAKFMLNRPGSVSSATNSFSFHPTQAAPPSRPGFDFDKSINGMLSDVTAASKVQVEQTDTQAMASYASQAMNGMMSSSLTIGGVPNPMNVGTFTTAGPDYYDPTGPDGAEPSEQQTSGPQKCTRMLNAWLYKCALSPL